MDDGVGLGHRQQPRDDRAADVRLDEVRALEIGQRGLGVDPRDVVDPRVALEPARQFGPPMSRDPGDGDPPAAVAI